MLLVIIRYIKNHLLNFFSSKIFSFHINKVLRDFARFQLDSSKDVVPFENEPVDESEYHPEKNDVVINEDL